VPLLLLLLSCCVVLPLVLLALLALLLPLLSPAVPADVLLESCFGCGFRGGPLCWLYGCCCSKQ
jgi:hypothetical protein